MNIIPISGLPSPGVIDKTPGVSPLGGSGVGVSASQAGASPFRDMFENALGAVEEMEAISAQDSYNLALGQVDDLGQLQINSLKREVSVQLLIQMRDKVLNAYNEIMRMNI